MVGPLEEVAVLLAWPQLELSLDLVPYIAGANGETLLKATLGTHGGPQPCPNRNGTRHLDARGKAVTSDPDGSGWVCWGSTR